MAGKDLKNRVRLLNVNFWKVNNLLMVFKFKCGLVQIIKIVIQTDHILTHTVTAV